MIDHVTPGGGIVATVEVGNNSAAGGAPEFTLSGATVQGQCTWDQDTSNGFEGGGEVSLTAIAGAVPSAIWWVGPAITSNPSFHTIAKVEIQAVAKHGCKLEWGALRVTFLKGGEPSESIL